MIIGTLHHTESIERMHPLLKEALQWLRTHAATAHQKDITRQVLKEGILWANVETPAMKSKAEQMLELHQQYIDIHVPVDKDETIGYLPDYYLPSPHIAYNPERDIAFYTAEPLCYITLHPGEFAIFTPHDAHAPIIGEGHIQKICMKLKV